MGYEVPGVGGLTAIGAPHDAALCPPPSLNPGLTGKSLVICNQLSKHNC